MFGRKALQHGHNYRLEVTLRGEPGAKSGLCSWRGQGFLENGEVSTGAGQGTWEELGNNRRALIGVEQKVRPASFVEELAAPAARRQEITVPIDDAHCGQPPAVGHLRCGDEPTLGAQRESE